jgi:hypothetical protein
LEVQNDGFTCNLFVAYWRSVLGICPLYNINYMVRKMTTFTSEDRQSAQEPIPFFGWIDKEDTEQMLRHQLQVMQNRINFLEEECMALRKQLNEL